MTDQDYLRDLEYWRDYRKRYPLQRGIGAKARPKCRRVIIESSLKPYPAVDCWDGFSARDTERSRIFMSDGLRKEMRRMIFEGYW